MLKVGAALPGCVARRNEAEGQFRFGMMRLRDNAESVALLGGGPGERRILSTSYARVVGCWLDIVRQHARLTWITNASGPMIPIVPLLFAAPKYISGELTLGQVTQLAAAFVQVQIAISWLVDHYGKIAEWYASARRVMEIVEACDGLPEGAAPVEATAPPQGAMTPLWKVGPVAVSRGQWVQLNGDSSAGKSTLVRKLCALDGAGAGSTDRIPMVLPQRSYLPPGSLAQLLAYPATPDSTPQPDMQRALEQGGLGHLAARLDETARWDSVLSLGERQRLAAVRVMLTRPDALIIDDALSALDEPAQRALFNALRAAAPAMTVVFLSRQPVCEDCFDQVAPLTAMCV
jgi:putative ATP-binding cassette transporter